jgi:hypothetical protein
MIARLLIPTLALVLAAPAVAQAPSPAASALLQGLDVCIRAVDGTASLDSAAPGMGYARTQDGKGWVRKAPEGVYATSTRSTTTSSGVVLTTCVVSGPPVPPALLQPTLARKAEQYRLPAAAPRTDATGGTVTSWLDGAGRGVIAITMTQHPADSQRPAMTSIAVLWR